MERKYMAISTESTESEKGASLKDFSYSTYRNLAPEEVRDQLEKVFTDQVYGWKRKARILLRLQNAHSWVQDVEQELIEACEGRSVTRQPRSKQEMARTSVRGFLNSLEDNKLEVLCDKHNVSFNSFMSVGDKVGLVEALLDEMLASE